MSSSPNPGSGGSPTPVPNPQAQGGPAGGQPRGPPMGPPDPMDGAFPGGVPNKNVDLPITLMFMLLFIIGAYVHMTIYKKNAKGGHKFLLSLPIFQFCMVRIVTCLFRVVWSLVTTRGVVLMAQITENGGAVALFAVNIFFAQRLVRSIHPKWGWATGFGQLIFILVITIPVVVIFNVTTAIVSFLSAGNADRLEVTEDLLMLETSWITSLAIFPIIVVSASLSIPGPKPERFGSGSQRVKVALLYFASVLLITGQSIRMYSVFAKEPPGTTNFAYSKEVFYTTGFAFELVVVGLYALFRVDLRFHIPNGSSGPGDYSGNGKNGGYTVEEIERMIGSLDVPHQIMRERKGSEDMDMVFTIFFASKKDDETAAKVEDATLAKTPKRTTRRKTLLNAFKPREPPIPGDPNDYPDVAHMYQEGGGGEYAARQSGKLSTFSPFDNSKVSDARYQQYWRSYGKEKGTKAWEA
ncbi:hypothetical protein CTA2_3923 [Colletotrichum tanaceti]|uniref:Protein RTA1 n=1 Tax=Colletotrichum tanaceti TaxID=1306861 RepID=A0A4V6DIB2_9PEZI|nr:hypothetical protein CTA2_3923 [Colletotrichum tanaceti]TKW59066.1 hypothetical protein CTA1_13333 [Colletotrichum tanaceti]